jgi:hypothetical protein
MPVLRKRVSIVDSLIAKSSGLYATITLKPMGSLRKRWGGQRGWRCRQVSYQDWSKNDGDAVVYNELGSADDSNPTIVLGGGSSVIHTELLRASI